MRLGRGERQVKFLFLFLFYFIFKILNFFNIN